VLQCNAYGGLRQYVLNQTTAVDGINGRSHYGGQVVTQLAVTWRVVTWFFVTVLGFGRSQFTCRGSVQAETPATTSNWWRSWLTTCAASDLVQR